MGNRIVFSPLLGLFLVLNIFANGLMAETCFCGNACLHGLQDKTETSASSTFHVRCSGTQCKSCNFEDIQKLKASNTAHLTEQLKTLDTPLILSNFSNYQFNINLITIFFSRLNKYVKAQSSPTYLQNLSLLL